MGHVITLKDGENVIVGNDENFLDSKYFEVIEETLGYEFLMNFKEELKTNYFDFNSSEYVTLAEYNDVLHDYERLQKDYDALSVEYRKLLEDFESFKVTYDPITPF